MRKIKKINGYLVVRFNEREVKLWEGAIGHFGVIDAELYTGDLDLDYDQFEYNSAETLEEAVEQARALESEFDECEEVNRVRIITETDNTLTEDSFSPELLIDEQRGILAAQIRNRHFPNVNPDTARHQLYGFKVALRTLGIINHDDCYVEPDDFEPLQQEANADSDLMPGPREFINLPPDQIKNAINKNVFELGLALQKDCPQNDCRVFLNIFGMACDLDEQAGQLHGWAREVVGRELAKLYFELGTMYMTNYAIKQYRKERQQ